MPCKWKVRQLGGGRPVCEALTPSDSPTFDWLITLGKLICRMRISESKNRAVGTKDHNTLAVYALGWGILADLARQVYRHSTLPLTGSRHPTSPRDGQFFSSPRPRDRLFLPCSTCLSMIQIQHATGKWLGSPGPSGETPPSNIM